VSGSVTSRLVQLSIQTDTTELVGDSQNTRAQRCP
jgi:hypothetical protein